MPTVIDGQQIKRPHPLLTAAEAVRAPWELASYGLVSPLLRVGPTGDGHPVLVLPGFLADDRSTLALRRVLGRRGLTVSGWGLGPNLGPSEEVVSGIPLLLQQLTERYGTKVSLVGWSLGGILAREFARLSPQLVRDVITLGSPYQLRLSDRPDLTSVGKIFKGLRPMHVSGLGDSPRESERTPIDCPTTSIYSRSDGVVPWRACISDEGPVSENVEVGCSHCGLGVDPFTLSVVIDRLVQPEGTWRRYRRLAFPRLG